MSRAVDSTLPGYQRAQLGRVVGPAERRERPERRREPGVEHVGRTAPSRRRRGARPARRSEPSGANQTGRRWPHHSWREMHHGRIDSIQSKKIFSSRFGWNVMRPLRTASIAVRGELLHLAEPLQRHDRLDAGARALAEADRVVQRLLGDDPPLRAQLRQRRLVALLEREPLPLRLQVAQPALLVHEQQRVEPVVEADLEVERVVAGRHLQGAGAESELDAVVGHDRHRPVDQRHDRRARRSGGSSAGRRGARRRRCRPGSSPAARSRSRSRRRPRRRSAPSTARRRPRGARPRGRRWRSGAATTSSRGGCRGRCSPRSCRRTNTSITARA